MNDYDVVISFLTIFEFCCILPYPFYPLPTDFLRIFKRNHRTMICWPIKQSNSLTTQQPNSLFFHHPIVSNNKSIYFHPLNHFQSNNSNNKSNNHRNDSYITTTTTATATANRRRKSIVSDFIIVFVLVSMLNDTIHWFVSMYDHIQ